MLKSTHGLVLVLPSERLVRPAADNDFILELENGKTELFTAMFPVNFI